MSQDANFRNLFVNGTLQINQRRSASWANNAYFIDRWKQASSGVTPTIAWTYAGGSDKPYGVTHRLAVTGAASWTPGASEYVIPFYQKIEGALFRSLNWGTAAALPLTLTFVTDASEAMTVAVYVKNEASDRSYVTTLAVTTGVQRLSVTIPGDTSGTWPTGTDPSSTSHVEIGFGAVSGSTYQTSALNSWVGVNYFSHSSATNWGTSSRSLSLRAAQAEIGGVATPLEALPFDVDLARCCRYYQKSYSYATVPGTASTTLGNEYAYLNGLSSSARTFGMSIKFHTIMRTDPTITGYSPVTGTSGQVRDITNSADVTATPSYRGTSGFTMSATQSVAATSYEFAFQWAAEADF